MEGEPTISLYLSEITLADYAQAMSEAVEAIAAVEERSELDVFYDLAGTGADVIRVGAPKGPPMVRFRCVRTWNC